MKAHFYHSPGKEAFEGPPKPEITEPDDAVVKIVNTTICFECGALNGKGQPGNRAAIVGSGPIGLAALRTAQFVSPAEFVMIDFDDNRSETAERFGATHVVNSADGKTAEAVLKLTTGRGVDTAIEAVGIPATFELCEKIIAPARTIANVGVHGVTVDLHLENLWDRNIMITARLVDTASLPDAAQKPSIAPDRRQPSQYPSLQVRRQSRRLRNLRARG